MDDIFPMHQPYEIIKFGKYKDKTFKDVYETDPAYIYWLIEQDPYYKINIPKIIGNEVSSEEEFIEICKAEFDRVFPKITASSVITFGKYKGKTFKEIATEDKNYIYWFLNNTKDRIDYDSFKEII